MSMSWFRMYAEFATDPVVQSLAFEDQRHFVMIMCFKCSGLLDRASVNKRERNKIILRGLGLDSVSADEARRRLIDAGLIDANWQPKNWNKRQFISDNSTARVAKHRKNKDSGNVSETPPDTDTDTDTETDLSNPPLVPPSGEAEPGKRKRGQRRCPSDFSITPEMRKWAAATCSGVDIETETAAFMDHEFADARTDWPAAWRNWLRRAQKFGSRRQEPVPQNRRAWREFPDGGKKP